MITMIPISRLVPHPNNPRINLGDLTELADSIKANGIMQNLTVVRRECQKDTDLYTVVIGHRRLAAATIAEFTEVPCSIAELTENEQLAIMLAENMQRTDLTVYEQACGMQMMIDLGETLETIAAKTGFSQSTVRRRVKMMELDRDKLREVSERQITLADFDRLAQIEDLDKRNKCLEAIGTSNFDMEVNAALRKANIAKNLPLVKERLKELGAKAIKPSERYGMKYDSVGGYIYIYDVDDASKIEPTKKIKKPFYYLEEDYGHLQFFEERKKAAPVKRSREEIDKEKRIEAAWSALREKTEITHQLRADFVKKIPVNTKTLMNLLRGCLAASVLELVYYIRQDTTGICETLGISDDYNSRRERAMNALAGIENAQIPSLVYAMYGDSKDIGYTSGYQKEYPKYVKSHVLDALYAWLCSLGYVMSDEEKQLQDGTHELFIEEQGK